ncbi:hypothetical protein [Spongiactinospora sp. TRM90649]|uniref:hypothetical protein n=1 Tax=Spongiactinospora sp. TRM90649 TaxID=3031114 RepID=UPI0023F77AF2|nr:hypothetical protein [Spongiactinospora sp. TRM90649]MDF5754051.1 hypothetical protein [Spongiactinospora sp. TRM90649]
MMQFPLIGAFVAASLWLTPSEKIARRARRRTLLARLRQDVLAEKAARSERRDGTVPPPKRARPRRPKRSRR